MMKNKHKIHEAIRKMPKGSALHAKYHPNTLEEISPEWGHHQLDVIGLFLYKTGDLIKKGHSIIDEPESAELISDIIQYLFTYRWETHPDFGMWEEGPELHSSSIGAVLAGLTMWFDEGHYHYKYQAKIDLSKIVPVSERLFDTGPEALKKILPRESETRECDLAQLSLIWPYNIVDEEMKKTIIDNIETKLLKSKGVIRYAKDYYYNADEKNLLGNEAEWPLGICWLAIVHNKMALWGNDLKDQLSQLYSKGKPNENMPLAWAHSFHIIALQSFINAVEKVRKTHKIEITEDLEAK